MNCWQTYHTRSTVLPHKGTKTVLFESPVFQFSVVYLTFIKLRTHSVSTFQLRILTNPKCLLKSVRCQPVWPFCHLLDQNSCFVSILKHEVSSKIQ